MVYRFNWFSFGFAQNKFISTKLCAISRPSPVSSSTHLDDPGVVIATGYVAIPPRDLTDPDSREFSASLLFKPTDTGRNDRVWPPTTSGYLQPIFSCVDSRGTHPLCVYVREYGMWYVRGYVLGEEGVNASTSRGRNSNLEG